MLCKYLRNQHTVTNTLYLTKNLLLEIDYVTPFTEGSIEVLQKNSPSQTARKYNITPKAPSMLVCTKKYSTRGVSRDSYSMRHGSALTITYSTTILHP